jgi:acyl-coenzyme A thioesterase PaaI-like protein
MIRQQDSNACFVCGKENAAGLRLDFHEIDGRVETTFMPGLIHQGWPGHLHGGILYAVLDEVMGRVGFTFDAWLMTGRVEIRYRAPVPIGEPLRLVGALVRDRGRAVELQGFAQLPDGTVVAEATGLYMRVPDDVRQSLEAQIAEGF